MKLTFILPDNQRAVLNNFESNKNLYQLIIALNEIKTFKYPLTCYGIRQNQRKKFSTNKDLSTSLKRANILNNSTLEIFQLEPNLYRCDQEQIKCCFQFVSLSKRHVCSGTM